MNHLTWQGKLGIVLVLCTASVYTVKSFTIGNMDNTINYIFNSFGFLFINVMFVTLVINELLSVRAKKAKIEKLNMVIGTFFSETGLSMLKTIIMADPETKALKDALTVDASWTEKEFKKAAKMLNNHKFSVDTGMINFQDLNSFMQEKRNFMLRLLENPVLLEHETFTLLLQAAFHLTEELERRGSFENLPESDINHLKGDIERVYGYLVIEWLAYMKHLSKNYPYLLSLCIRTNPFDEDCSVVVK